MLKNYQIYLKNCANKRKLARDTGLSYSFINHLQRGIKQPSMETLEILAKHFNVSASYLLREKETKND